MHKTELNLLCQRKKWPLPVYSSEKEGQDHNPTFWATVQVKGRRFISAPAKTTKIAQNDAAKVALVHFSSSSYLHPLPLPAPTSATDMQHLYQNMLQSHAQQGGPNPPGYRWEQEPPYALPRSAPACECLERLSALNYAEHAAANAALAPDVVADDESAYKNLLQEWAQQNYHNAMPSYSTMAYVEHYKPTFVSTVEIAGLRYTGNESRTKKQAEFNAAKTAYRDLKKRESDPRSTVPNCSNLTCQSAGCSYGSGGDVSPPHQRQRVVSPFAFCSQSGPAALQRNSPRRNPGSDKPGSSGLRLGRKN